MELAPKPTFVSSLPLPPRKTHILLFHASPISLFVYLSFPKPISFSLSPPISFSLYLLPIVIDPLLHLLSFVVYVDAAMCDSGSWFAAVVICLWRDGVGFQ